MENLSILTDEELVFLAQKEDKQATSILIERYKNIVKATSRSYFLIGGDNDDLFQEGLIGLFNAILSFNGKSSFKSYAYTCVRNSIVSVIRSYNALKHQPLINYISISPLSDADSDKTNFVIDENVFDPETDFINKESIEELKNKISLILSKLENMILSLYLQGFSYMEIAEKTDKNVKSIDNAIQRIRNKVSAIINKVG